MLVFHDILTHEVEWGYEVLLKAKPMQTTSLFIVPQLQPFCLFTVLRCGVSGNNGGSMIHIPKFFGRYTHTMAEGNLGS